MLYRNLSDMIRRVRTPGQNTPLDGMLTQQGDAFLRLRVPAAAHGVPISVDTLVRPYRGWSAERLDWSTVTRAHVPRQAAAR